VGLFWDLIQHNQISEQRSRSASLEERVTGLERELEQTRQVMRTLLERLETLVGEDIDRDGSVGAP
jgi:uncharacterized coiled-coil protein SlyX